jgi:predicted O-linked N-acetylglucosamine transferase (SPINDLY family)
VFAYSFGPDDGSSYRRRIAAECEHFCDVAGLAVNDLARRIHADGIQVLIDLMGYTGVHRIGALALRPAPLQVSYLGMLGTTGADFIDYLITDPVATPPALAEFFTEKFVTLPHSYLVTDPRPEVGRRLGRAGYGLPEEAFVFCSFNNAYKIEPEGFGVWMNILTQVPGGVLWLYAPGPAVEANLRREAAARGVNPERLRFAPLVPRAEHLARHEAADLFLDTWRYNAAATASLALGMGLPVLTCPGQTLASRVGASLLTAVGLPELIAPDLEAYERLAVRLARQPDALRALRDQLAAHRTTWPLFDTPRLVRNLERAYRAMWEIHASGKPPQPIVVIE